MLSILLIILLSYLIGSIPTSIILSKLKDGTDIRDYGSGNAGGTNAFRILGWRYGLIVAVVDIGKGIVATVLVSKLRIDTIPFSNISIIEVFAGLSAIIGHTFTLFAGFRGGKGVATGAGMLIGLNPVAFLICIAVFCITLFSSGIVSIASMLGALTFPVALFLFKIVFSSEIDVFLLIFSLIIPFFIIFTHRENVLRVFKGEEHIFGKIAIFRGKRYRQADRQS